MLKHSIYCKRPGTGLSPVSCSKYSAAGGEQEVKTKHGGRRTFLPPVVPLPLLLGALAIMVAAGTRIILPHLSSSMGGRDRLLRLP